MKGKLDFLSTHLEAMLLLETTNIKENLHFSSLPVGQDRAGKCQNSRLDLILIFNLIKSVL